MPAVTTAVTLSDGVEDTTMYCNIYNVCPVSVHLKVKRKQKRQTTATLNTEYLLFE